MTDSNFRGKVLDGGEPWLVEFYAPWCGHCQRLEPEWKSAASEVHEKTGNKVKMGMLDATQHQNTASQYGIQGTLQSVLLIKMCQFSHRNVNINKIKDIQQSRCSSQMDA